MRAVTVHHTSYNGQVHKTRHRSYKKNLHNFISLKEWKLKNIVHTFSCRIAARSCPARAHTADYSTPATVFQMWNHVPIHAHGSFKIVPVQLLYTVERTGFLRLDFYQVQYAYSVRNTEIVHCMHTVNSHCKLCAPGLASRLSHSTRLRAWLVDGLLYM